MNVDGALVAVAFGRQFISQLSVRLPPEDELELPDLEDHVRGAVAAELDADASRQAPINEGYIVKADTGIKMEADVLDSDH